MPIFHQTAPILRKINLGTQIVSLVMRAPEMAQAVQPGQFIMVRVREDIHPLLRRAYSVSRIFPEESALEIMIQKAGRGSSILLQKEEGEMVDILGPLGSSFQFFEKEKPAILVGGGIGIAPMFFLGQMLGNAGIPFQILFGGRSHANVFLLPEFEGQMSFCTEDGSFARKGLITDLLEEKLRELPGAQVFACGPNVMLRAVANLCEQYGASCQISMEAPMACGVGVCMGCPVPVKTGAYQYVCKDGPVFNATMIDFERL